MSNIVPFYNGLKREKEESVGLDPNEKGPIGVAFLSPKIRGFLAKNFQLGNRLHEELAKLILAEDDRRRIEAEARAAKLRADYDALSLQEKVDKQAEWGNTLFGRILDPETVEIIDGLEEDLGLKTNEGSQFLENITTAMARGDVPQVITGYTWNVGDGYTPEGAPLLKPIYQASQPIPDDVLLNKGLGYAYFGEAAEPSETNNRENDTDRHVEYNMYSPEELDIILKKLGTVDPANKKFILAEFTRFMRGYKQYWAERSDGRTIANRKSEVMADFLRRFYDSTERDKLDANLIDLESKARPETGKNVRAAEMTSQEDVSVAASM